MVGASNWRILRRHLIPHLAPVLLVWGAIAVGTNILAEVGLSFLGIGVQASTPSLGSLLSTIWGTIFNAVRVRPEDAHGVADGLPDGLDRHDGRVAQPALGSDPTRDRPEGAGAVRAARYLLRRTLRGVMTLAVDDRDHVRALLRDRAAATAQFLLPANRARVVAQRRRTRSRWRITSSTSTVRRSVCTSSTSATSRTATSAHDPRRSRTASSSMGPDPRSVRAAARDPVAPHRRRRPRRAPRAAARSDLRQPNRLVGRPGHLVRRARPRLLPPDDARPHPARTPAAESTACRRPATARSASTRCRRPGAFYPPGFEPCGGPTHWFTHLLPARGSPSRCSSWRSTPA